MIYDSYKEAAHVCINPESCSSITLITSRRFLSYTQVQTQGIEEPD